MSLSNKLHLLADEVQKIECLLAVYQVEKKIKNKKIDKQVRERWISDGYRGK